MSMKGVHCGLRLPVRILATSVASRPTVCPAASTTNHLRFSASPLPLGKYVDIDSSLWKKRLKRERLEYRNAQKNVKLCGRLLCGGGEIVRQPFRVIRPQPREPFFILLFGFAEPGLESAGVKRRRVHLFELSEALQ